MCSVIRMKIPCRASSPQGPPRSRRRVKRSLSVNGDDRCGMISNGSFAMTSSSNASGKSRARKRFHAKLQTKAQCAATVSGSGGDARPELLLLFFWIDPAIASRSGDLQRSLSLSVTRISRCRGDGDSCLDRWVLAVSFLKGYLPASDAAIHDLSVPSSMRQSSSVLGSRSRHTRHAVSSTSRHTKIYLLFMFSAIGSCPSAVSAQILATALWV